MTSENIIAISVSEGPDLDIFGFRPQHLRRLLASLAGTVLRAGWRIGYGGDLRKDGYTRALLADMAAAHARGDAGRSLIAPVVHFFAFSSWQEMSPEAILNHLMDKELPPGMLPIAPIAETRFFLPAAMALDRRAAFISVSVVDGELRNDSGQRMAAAELLTILGIARGEPGQPHRDLTGMRRVMANSSPLRIQFSGRVDGYAGEMPGIFEEAVAQIRTDGIVMPLGAFGGAAREVAIGLGLLEQERTRYPTYGKNYDEAYSELRQLAARHRERAGPLWPNLVRAASLDIPYQILFELKQMLAMNIGRPAPHGQR